MDWTAIATVIGVLLVALYAIWITQHRESVSLRVPGFRLDASGTLTLQEKAAERRKKRKAKKKPKKRSPEASEGRDKPVG